MAVAQGYGKTVTSGSVFAYDVADTRNSYIGEPTTNFVKNDSWGGDGVSQTLITKGKVTITDPTLQYKGLHTVLWAPGTSRNCYLNGSGPLYFDQTSTVWTFSCYLKREDGAPISGVNVYMYNIGSNAGVGTIQDVGDGWYRVSRTVSTAANYVSLVGFYNLVANIRYYLSGWQLEKKGHPTPVTALTATRSATQGLLPLVGNSTIDLSTVSFDSNAQMVFDGTNDYINVDDGQDSGYERSFEYVVKFNTISGTYEPIAAYTYGTGAPSGRIWLGLQNISGYRFRMHGWGSDDPYSTTTSVTTGKFYHVTHTYNYNTREMRLYVNGVDEASDVYDNQGLSAWSNTSAFSWYLGYDPYSYGGVSNSNIELPVFKTYNRALTAAEVKQNFDFYDARFGIEIEATYYYVVSNRAARYKRFTGTGKNMATSTPAYILYQKPDASNTSPGNYTEVAIDDIGTPTRTTIYGDQLSYSNGRYLTDVTVYKSRRGGKLSFEFPNGGTSQYGEEFYKTIITPYVP